MTLAEVHAGPDGAGVHIEVTIAAPPDRVWHAITDPGALEAWLAPVDLVPTPAPFGGYVIRFVEGDHTAGEISACAPPGRLTLTWQIGDDTTQLGIELRSAPTPASETTDHGDGDGTGTGATTLTLDHTGLPAVMGRGYGAGWQAHLERLDAHLRGRPLPDWGTRIGELLA